MTSSQRRNRAGSKRGKRVSAKKARGVSSSQTAAPPDGDAFAQAALKNVFEIWFTPEIERRRSAGLIGDDFVLMLAQVIFPQQGSNQIRLNDEVRGVMTVAVKRAMEKGEQVLLSDLEGVAAFELIDEELDCGHFTIIRRGVSENWVLTFNALAGRRKAANLVRLAHEFLEATKLSIERQHSGPAIDNLFSCCELLAKAELIMHRLIGEKSKRHGAIGRAINQWGRLGNAHPQFVATMNRMSNLRSAARYDGTTGIAQLPTHDEIKVVEAYLAQLRRRSAAKIEDGQSSNDRDGD